jgi:hypothetical protein
MRKLVIFLFALCVFIGCFFVLSFIGLVYTNGNYFEVITNETWIAMYNFIAQYPTFEATKEFEKEFDRWLELRKIRSGVRGL